MITPMNRSIKFRAWWKEKKIMAKVGHVGIGEWKTFLDSVRVNELAAEHYTSVWLKNSEIELMQFTGLLDSKGREIYESDVIEVEMVHQEFNSALKKTGEIVFYQGCFCFKDEKGGLLEMSGWNSATSKIIGNIYENPDLLSPKEETKK